MQQPKTKMTFRFDGGAPRAGTAASAEWKETGQASPVKGFSASRPPSPQPPDGDGAVAPELSPQARPDQIRLPRSVPDGVQARPHIVTPVMKADGWGPEQAGGNRFQDDVEALERMIRTAQTSETEPLPVKPGPSPTSRRPAPKESVPPVSADAPVQPGADEVTGGEAPNPEWLARYPYSEPPSWWRVFASVAAAVVTGALFGYLVLSLFTGQPLFPGSRGPDAQAGATVPPPASSAAAGQASPKKQAAASATSESAGSESLPADAYYMLQYGVFQTEDNMNAAVRELQAKGLAAAADDSGGYRVYAGLAPTKDEAQLLVRQLPQVEVYVKAVNGEAIRLSGVQHAAEWRSLLENGAALTRELAGFTVSALQQSAPKAPSENQVAALEKLWQRWKSSADAAAGLDGAARKPAEALVRDMNDAWLAWRAFAQTPGRDALWQVQTSVMKAVLDDRGVREALAQAASA